MLLLFGILFCGAVSARSGCRVPTYFQTGCYDLGQCGRQFDFICSPTEFAHVRCSETSINSLDISHVTCPHDGASFTGIGGRCECEMNGVLLGDDMLVDSATQTPTDLPWSVDGTFHFYFSVASIATAIASVAAAFLATALVEIPVLPETGDESLTRPPASSRAPTTSISPERVPLLSNSVTVNA